MGSQELGVVLAGHEGVRWFDAFPLLPQLITGHRQPILADEVQTFKALITIHKVLQEGHPIVLKEAQAHINWLESLTRGVAGGEGLRGTRQHDTSRSHGQNAKQLNRLWPFDIRIHLLLTSQAGFPSAAP